MRKALTMTLATMAALAVAGTAHAQDKKTYGVLLKTLSNPFWGAMEQGIEDAAKAQGVDYYLQAVESDQAAEPQLNVCNTMLERKPAVMLVAAINSTNLLPCLKRANEEGIPVVDLDANIDYAIAQKAGVKIAFSIGSDNVEAGRKGADYVASTLGPDARGPVLVIEGLSGNITGQKRAQGFKEELAKAAPGLKVVASLPGDWDRGKAANITNDTLTQYPDLRAIFAANDVMALGAVETVYAAGQGRQHHRGGRGRQQGRGEKHRGGPAERQRGPAPLPRRQGGGGEGDRRSRRQEGAAVHRGADARADGRGPPGGHRPAARVRQVAKEAAASGAAGSRERPCAWRQGRRRRPGRLCRAGSPSGPNRWPSWSCSASSWRCSRPTSSRSRTSSTSSSPRRRSASWRSAPPS